MSDDEKEKLILTLKLKEILQSSIDDFVSENPQANLDSPAAREVLSIFITSYLSPYVKEYEDEISSLWFMLDELKNSELALKADGFNNEVESMVQLQMAKLKLMQSSKGEA